MDRRLFFSLLGTICYGVAGVMMIPVLTSVYYREDCLLQWFFSIAVVCLTGLSLRFFGKGALGKNISVREGIGIVCFSWLIVAAMSSVPLVITGVLDPVSAYFESMSGLTTTGATVIDDLTVVPHSIMLWRGLNHWIGGLGIIVIFVALLPRISGNVFNLFNAEVSGFVNTRIKPRLRVTALTLFAIYVFLTTVLIILLMFLGMNFFDAVNHSFSAVATGGFSTHNESVAYFNSPAIEYVLAVFMLIAGGNFSLYYRLIRFEWNDQLALSKNLSSLFQNIKILWQDTEFRVYIGLALLFSLLIAANIAVVCGTGLSDSLRYAFFQVASFGSTTGFVSYDYDKWPAFSKLLLAVMFFTGGCAGSTAGGIKISRFIVLFKTVAAEMRRTLHPRILFSVMYNGKELPSHTIVNVSRFFFVYILTIAVLSAALSATGLGVEESIFGVASCVSSVGPAFDSLGAVHNFSGVSSVGKIVLSLAMLLGRLELFTVLALLRSDYWKNNKSW